MKKLILPLIMITTMLSFSLNAQTPIAAPKESPKDNKVSLDLAQLSATMILNIKSSPSNKSPKENYFNGVKDCDPPTATSALVEFTGKCLEFKTQSKPDVNVPIEVVNAPADPNAFDELAQAYKKNQTQIRQVQKQQFKWGSFYHWSTVGKEPSHYIFLSTVNKKLTVRIGPIPNSVKSLYKLNWSLKPWQ